jgi:hypothetical protein
MCRSIKTLHNFRPPATAEEIRASALQFVRKLSGFTTPSKANELAFTCARRPGVRGRSGVPGFARQHGAASRPGRGGGEGSGQGGGTVFAPVEALQRRP